MLKINSIRKTYFFSLVLLNLILLIIPGFFFEWKHKRIDGEELVKERTKELERFNRLFAGREFRIKKIKHKLKELEKNL